MNDPHFEVFPKTFNPTPYEEGGRTEFFWHFQAADGKITHVGGEAFTRREDAHRSIEGVGLQFADMFGIPPALAAGLVDKLPIVDLDAEGQPIVT